MKQHLQQMDPIKSQRLIDATIQEFAQYPFEKASTNSIVRTAGISKGLLFHYFKDKKALYDKALNFTIHTLVTEISQAIQWEERDLLERIKQLTLAKMKIFYSHPDMFDFLARATQEESTSLRDPTFYTNHGVTLSDILTDVFTKNIDTTLFKDQSKIQSYIEISQWVVDGMSQKYSEIYATQLENQGPTGTQRKELLYTAEKEVCAYITMLKELFYRPKKEKPL